MICQALVNGKLCTYDSPYIHSGKYLGLEHITLLRGGEQLKWAPKRLLEWGMDAKLKRALERETLAQLNRRYYDR